MSGVNVSRSGLSMRLFGIVTVLLALTLVSCGAQQPAPPVAKVAPKADTLFGDVRVDDYFWLREKTNPEVIAYLEAENAYTEAVTAHTQVLQDQIYQEMVGRIKETDLDVPVKIDDYYYYTRSEEGKQYKINCRKKGSLDAPEEILIDQNEFAGARDYFDLGIYRVSPNHQLLAYGIDTAGNELYTIRIKDLATGRLLTDEIPNASTDCEWANDNKTIFYSTLDEAHRPYKLWRHVLGGNPADDALVYHEEDDAFFLGIGKTKSRAYLLLSLGSIASSEVRFLDAGKPTGSFRVIQPREKNHEYDVAHHGNRFYITTNDGARNFRLVSTPVRKPSKENWKDVLPHREDVKVDGAEAFANHLVVYERKDGLKQIHILNPADGSDHYVTFPEPVYTYQGSSNPDFNTNLVRFTYTSLVTPRSVFDYNMDDQSRDLKKEYEVLGGYDRAQYQSARILATAPDGVEIPISLVYRKDITPTAGNPLYLYGYGSYGYSMEPRFSSNRLSLLERGFIFAIAHVRGGGEMGRWWYEDGKWLKKKNTFTDFIACAEHLVAQGYTSPEKLVMSGGSAGGLLVGAVVNMRPDLFKVMVAEVPFVDVVNTMLDESIPLTVVEFDEWGNPKEEEYYHYMKSYSPYDNVEAKDYPHMMITAGLNDPRVQYWEPAKWTAKLRARKTDDNLLVFKTEMGAGHGGSSGRYDYLKDLAFEYAFILDRLGMAQ
ncbi:MAG TPA: S9 family peptidase [Acidobacteriota bacterium]|nr:S9 family peptidase [Acidobacteriota bacterium]